MRRYGVCPWEVCVYVGSVCVCVYSHLSLTLSSPSLFCVHLFFCPVLSECSFSSIVGGQHKHGGGASGGGVQMQEAAASATRLMSSNTTHSGASASSTGGGTTAGTVGSPSARKKNTAFSPADVAADDVQAILSALEQVKWTDGNHNSNSNSNSDNNNNNGSRETKNSGGDRKVEYGAGGGPDRFDDASLASATAGLGTRWQWDIGTTMGLGGDAAGGQGDDASDDEDGFSSSDDDGGGDGDGGGGGGGGDSGRDNGEDDGQNSGADPYSVRIDGVDIVVRPDTRRPETRVGGVCACGTLGRSVVNCSCGRRAQHQDPSQPMPTAALLPVRSGSLSLRSAAPPPGRRRIVRIDFAQDFPSGGAALSTLFMPRYTSDINSGTTERLVVADLARSVHPLKPVMVAAGVQTGDILQTVDGESVAAMTAVAICAVLEDRAASAPVVTLGVIGDTSSFSDALANFVSAGRSPGSVKGGGGGGGESSANSGHGGGAEDEPYVVAGGAESAKSAELGYTSPYRPPAAKEPCTTTVDPGYTSPYRPPVAQGKKPAACSTSDGDNAVEDADEDEDGNEEEEGEEEEEEDEEEEAEAFVVQERNDRNNAVVVDVPRSSAPSNADRGKQAVRAGIGPTASATGVAAAARSLPYERQLEHQPGRSAAEVAAVAAVAAVASVAPTQGGHHQSRPLPAKTTPGAGGAPAPSPSETVAAEQLKRRAKMEKAAQKRREAREEKARNAQTPPRNQGLQFEARVERGKFGLCAMLGRGKGTMCCISAFRPLPDGSPGPLQAAGALAGDAIMRVQGESMEGLSVDQVTARLQAAPPTMALTLFRSLEPQAGGGVGGAGGGLGVSVSKVTESLGTVVGSAKATAWGSWAASSLTSASTWASSVTRESVGQVGQVMQDVHKSVNDVRNS